MLYPLLFLAFSIAFIFHTLHSKLAQKGNPDRTRKVSVICEEPDVGTNPEQEGIGDASGSDPTRVTRPLLIEIAPAISPKWEECGGGDGYVVEEKESVSVLGMEAVKEKRKKKKRAKKKRPDSNGEKEAREEVAREKQELVCVYPFTTSSSATQRRIKQQYDELVSCHASKGLKLAQVERFVNCLIETRNELEHKSETIQRKFTITKALIFRADRSSLDRLRQQMYKLELEQKRLEEDAFVYNWLQQQLKLSPAYKKMVEIGASLERKSKSREIKNTDAEEFTEISFEELLAREKKDVFWQRCGKPKPPCSN
ncbi:unnamed protein product [Cuscuta epithymum]|uniref:AT1G17665-like protein n=1 Tax=Cuscuta epithymum TaxID=186058 RepID=A0AAV0D2A2_9ASTE|nr:unnamed protein product [Cuscuta epithymum]